MVNINLAPDKQENKTVEYNVKITTNVTVITPLNAHTKQVFGKDIKKLWEFCERSIAGEVSL